MPWIKASNNPPDHQNWLKCDGCGWLSLKTQDRVYASEVGEPCKYCATPLRLATANDMSTAYPHGVYDWKDEPLSVNEDN